MLMIDGYRRLAEQQREKWRQFNLRLLEVGLPEANHPDFDVSFGGQYGAVRPRTRTGWAIFVSLREKEGGLTSAERDDVRYGLEEILISEKMEEIRIRLEAGGSLPDPVWPDKSPPILAESALSLRAESIFRWSAIKELGLDTDQHYSEVYRSAQSESHDFARQRGDIEKYFESLRPVYKTSSAFRQEPHPPSDFQKIDVLIPFSALKDESKSLDFIRYHPKHGLVRGWISENSYYDRGAGSYPGSRGARVKEFRPMFRLLLEDVDFRKCRDFKRTSVWHVVSDPPVILGRSKSTQSFQNDMYYGTNFDSKEDARGFLIGTIESDYVRETLPVGVEKCEAGFRLHFYGRPLI
jgi:hypothetical protein